MAASLAAWWRWTTSGTQRRLAARPRTTRASTTISPQHWWNPRGDFAMLHWLARARGGADPAGRGRRRGAGRPRLRRRAARPARGRQGLPARRRGPHGQRARPGGGPRGRAGARRRHRRPAGRRLRRRGRGRRDPRTRHRPAGRRGRGVPAAAARRAAGDRHPGRDGAGPLRRRHAGRTGPGRARRRASTTRRCSSTARCCCASAPGTACSCGCAGSARPCVDLARWLARPHRLGPDGAGADHRRAVPGLGRRAARPRVVDRVTGAGSHARYVAGVGIALPGPALAAGGHVGGPFRRSTSAGTGPPSGSSSAPGCAAGTPR